MIEKSKIIFIESNTSGTGELLIYKALSKGLHPIFIAKNPAKYSFLPVQDAELVILDTNNKELLYQYLSQVKNLYGIYSSSDNYIEIASWLAQKLGLPGTDCEAVKACRNKYSLYQTLIESDMDVPKTMRICCKEEAASILDECVLPVIIKPSMGTGSIGVKLCETKADCLKHINFLFDTACSDVLVQEYIDAPEFSVEVCSLSGKHQVMGITKKYTTNPPYFIETGHDFPAILPSEDEVNIIEVVCNALTKIGFDFGFSHTELKLKKGRAIILEVNPRLAGGMIPILIEKACGYDVLDYLVDLYTNQVKELEIQFRQFASIRHFIPTSSGKIKQLSFDNRLGVDQFKFIKKSGDMFSHQYDFRDRVAYLIVSNVEYTRCNEKANLALKNFEITFEE